MTFDQRIPAGTAAKLLVYCTDPDGELADPGGTTATVTVTRANGTALVTAQTATREEAGVFSYTLTAPQTAALDTLTAVWTLPNATTRTTTTEVAGRWYWSASDLKATERLDPKYLDADIWRARMETEEELERITDRAFVPRYGRFVVDADGSGTIFLPVGDLRTIRSITMLTSPGATTTTTLDATALAALSWPTSPDPTVSAIGMVTRNDLGTFTEGQSIVTVEAEYGLSNPPSDLWRATLARAKTRLAMANTSVAQRASSYTTPEGQTFQVDTADAWSTGLPDIDAVYSRYSARKQGKGPGGQVQSVPASRPMRVTVQRYSMFHSGGSGR